MRILTGAAREPNSSKRPLGVSRDAQRREAGRSRDASADLLTAYNTFALEIGPVQGTPLVVEKVIPQSLNPIMNLR